MPRTYQIGPRVLTWAPKITAQMVLSSSAKDCPHCAHHGLNYSPTLYGEEMAKWQRGESAAMRNVLGCYSCGWSEVGGAPKQVTAAEREAAERRPDRTTYGT